MLTAFQALTLGAPMGLSCAPLEIGPRSLREEMNGGRRPRANDPLLVQELRRAAAACASGRTDELRVFYEPVVEPHSTPGRLPRREFQAVLPWQHPTDGLLDAATFLNLAGCPELVIAVGAAVLTHDCSVAASWQDPDHEFSVAVDVSAVELGSPAFTERVRGALRATGAHPSWLRLNVTEQTLRCAGARVVAAMTALAELGVRWSSDVVGPAPSLGMAQRFPFVAVRVGRGLVAGLGDRRRAAEVGGIIFLASVLRLETVAEGVETLAQLNELTLLGCDHAQGALLGFSFDRALADVLVDAVPSSAPGRLTSLPHPVDPCSA